MDIFLDIQDKERFLKLLYVCNTKKPLIFKDIQGESLDEIERDGDLLVSIGAYCLMPNHFHILLREDNETGVTEFLKKVATAYSMYFNKKYERSGSLFQGAFKSRHVDNEPYLNWLFAYIHLNPVKIIEPMWRESGISNVKNAREFMEKYRYSSYHDYFVGERPETAILSKDSFPEHFATINEFDVLCDELKSDAY